MINWKVKYYLVQLKAVAASSIKNYLSEKSMALYAFDGTWNIDEEKEYYPLSRWRKTNVTVAEFLDYFYGYVSAR